MNCSACGTTCAGSCAVCAENPCESCKKCKEPCLRWGFDDCYLRARCPDGTELDPLNLCEWLKVHETCTEFKLVPNGEGGSYFEFINECDEIQRIYICDMLSLADLECLGNVVDEPANPCDILVYDPSCGLEGSKTYKKWTHYHIPDAGDCEIQPDANGFYKVLVKDDCGCIKECKLFVTNKSWEYGLRDSWPDDPDWPFSMGSRVGNNTEIIDLKLDQMIPMFGKTDLEVVFEYAYGIQNTDPGTQAYNFKSIVVPSYTPQHQPNVTDMVTKAIVAQGSNLIPWGSWEWPVSRTVIVPKGKKLYLIHTIEQRDVNGNLVPFQGEWANNGTPPYDSSRLHALRVVVRATKGEIL